MPGFVKFEAKYNNLPNNGSVLSDVANHCERYSYYRSPNSKTTTAHECTHGINADLRNGAVQIIGYGGRCGLPQPLLGLTETVRGGTNAFYALRDQAIRIPEPNTRKSDCVQFIPQPFHGPRYDLYVIKQREWDDSPLYLFDEWTAYANGTECAIVDNCGDPNSDEIFGPIEFVAYCTATMMAAKIAGPLDQDLVFYFIHTLKRSFDLYNKGKDKYPWDKATSIRDMLLTGNEGKDYRNFWGTLGYNPNNGNDTNDFYV